jgi:hypothetical protein
MRLQLNLAVDQIDSAWFRPTEGYTRQVHDVEFALLM